MCSTEGMDTVTEVEGITDTVTERRNMKTITDTVTITVTGTVMGQRNQGLRAKSWRESSFTS